MDSYPQCVNCACRSQTARIAKTQRLSFARPKRRGAVNGSARASNVSSLRLTTAGTAFGMTPQTDLRGLRELLRNMHCVKYLQVKMPELLGLAVMSSPNSASSQHAINRAHCDYSHTALPHSAGRAPAQANNAMVTAAPAVRPATPMLAAPLPGPFGLRVGVAAGEPFAGCGDGVALAPAGALQSRITLWFGNSAMPAVHVLSRNS